MLFGIIEHVMNGNVSSKTVMSAIEAESFELAKQALKQWADKHNLQRISYSEGLDIIRWTINSSVIVTGVMDSTPIKVLNKED